MNEFIEETWPLLVAILLTVLFGVFVLYNVMHEEERWTKFAKEHDCKVTSERAGTVLYNTTGNGGVIVVPSKKTWTCNNGVTYER